MRPSIPFPPDVLRNFLSIDVTIGWQQLVIAGLVIVCVGALVSALNGEFYKIYEGRMGWPRGLYNRAVAFQQRRVDHLNDQSGKLRGVDPQRYNEIWYQLRLYPIDNQSAKRHATRPTLLGNILEGYEQYPQNCYGMDAVFYWSRLWLVIDKDLKEDISKSWSVADGLLSLSAVSYLAGLLWLVAYTGAEIDLLGPNWFPLGDNFNQTLTAVAGWFLLGYALYRLSLPFHRQNGEVFKSLFDLYRDKLMGMTALAPHEKESWRAGWSYLQYLKIPCPKCNAGTISIFTNDCGNDACRAHQPEVVADFVKSGKLVSGIEADTPDLSALIAKFVKKS